MVHINRNGSHNHLSLNEPADNIILCLLLGRDHKSLLCLTIFNNIAFVKKDSVIYPDMR